MPADVKQAEFDFSPRVYDDPALTELCRLYDRGAINKYDAPVLAPLVRNVSAGAGVKESELSTIKRLIIKYAESDSEFQEKFQIVPPRDREI